MSRRNNAFQNPPASPVDNTYFSAVPFLFGPDRVMKYSARPVAPSAWGPPDNADKQPEYLRDALAERLDKVKGKEVVFEFQVQVRTKAHIAGRIVSEIEDACTEWPDAFTTVAMITIAPQDFNTEARRKQCEDLSFNPWHAIAEHQPLGGINRLKLGVYDASSKLRHQPAGKQPPAKQPAGN